MFGLSNEGLGNYARLLECLRFGYWLTLNYLGKDNELNIQLLKFKEEAEKNVMLNYNFFKIKFYLVF